MNPHSVYIQLQGKSSRLDLSSPVEDVFPDCFYEAKCNTLRPSSAFLTDRRMS